MEHTKRIKVLSNTAIRCKGGMHGPIKTPFNERISEIFKMLAEGISIVEVLNDGSELPLTFTNFNRNNTIITENVPVVEPEMVSAPAEEPVPVVEETVVEEVIEDVINDVVEEVIEEVVDENDEPAPITVDEPMVQKNNHNYNNKKNKNKR